MSDTREAPHGFATKAKKSLCRLARRFGASSALDRPLFIVGCGRSGTTALGEVLSVHGSVTYLNEPRHLWTDAYPETDIWSDRARARRGRLEMTELESTPSRSRRLVGNFYCETAASGRPRLVEKLPINTFRLPFVEASVPDARYLHLLRNGLEVARSIGRMIDEGLWYDAANFKWELLADYARRHPDYAGLLPLCNTSLLRGLLEWRMSVDACLAFLDRLPSERYMTIRYAELLNAPAAVMRRIQEFAELDPDPEVERFAESSLKRRSAVIEVAELSDVENRIAGDLMRRLGFCRG
jgi:hypothetical protein